MRDVAVVSFAQSQYVRSDTQRNEVEILMPVISEAIERSGIPRKEIGFTVSGSCDYLAGQPFAFVSALDAVGAWPPIRESHVEMDGAWALYEAWVRLQCGDVDSALVYAFGKSSLGDLRDVMTLQLDPYCVAPLWPDSISVAALQARAMLDAGRCTEREMAEVAARSRRDAQSNPAAQLTGDADAGRAASRAVRRVAAAQARLPADLRRRGRRRAGRGRSRAAREQAPGMDQRHRPPHRAARASACAI